jgi:hypothetical protein
MERDDIARIVLEFTYKFSGQQFVSKNDLRNFYRSLYPDFTEKTFRRILYALEKKDHIISIGRGMYAFQPGQLSQLIKKNKFIPTLSHNVKKINGQIKEAFPYMHYLIWETKILHEFMLHQPGQNQIIVETEQDGEHSLFNYLSGIYTGQAFLDPDRVTMERYTLQQPESILISKLISQTPMGKKISDVPYAKLEKILVDILVDDDKYFIFQGQELVNIFQNAFAQYWIDESSLIRYAGRRNADEKLKQFVLNQAQIEFRLINESPK